MLSPLGQDYPTGKTIKSLVYSLINSKDDFPLVIDADGLNVIDDPSALKTSGRDIVITPHPGEFARLTGSSVEDIQKNRISSACDFAKNHGVTVVLKGAYTIIAGKNGEMFINPYGNPGMATAGSGDVLTGIIASLIGQGAGTYASAVAAVYIHSMAAGLATSIKGDHGVIASDMIDSIPFAISSIT
jgi:hydroxyethylthiazole kinase-like uncharacterized protein yjeF